MKIRSVFVTKLAAFLAVGLLRILFRTLHVELRPARPGLVAYGPTGQDRFLYCTWHDSILMPIFAGRPWKMAALVSRHQDGSYLAEAMKRVGITPIRGSTYRGGTAALKQLITEAQDKHITITPDGPRGPRRKMKPGIVFLASQTGRPIVPMLFACPRAWRIRGNWTDLVIPKPFSTIIGLSGEPIHVPSNLSREGIQQHMGRVQQAMDELAARVAVLEGRPDPWEAEPARWAA